MNARTTLEGAGAEPHTFVRHLSAPPGLPWEQKRAANLEARMGAPGGGTGLQIKVVRTAPWRPGAHASFASVYLRAREPVEFFEAEVETPEGRIIRIPFRSAAAARRELSDRIRRTALVLAPVILGAAAILASLAVRADREVRIEAIEAKAARAERLATTLKRASADAALLQRAGANGRMLRSVLADLDWLSGAKTPETHIQAVHWENGLMAIQTRGQAPPVRTDGREVRKAEKPLAPGLYLWGVGAGPSRSPP